MAQTQILDVPQFQRTDSRVESRQHLRLATFVGGERKEGSFGIWVHALDQSLQLGALIYGKFHGQVEWQIDDQAWSASVDTERDSPVALAYRSTRRNDVRPLKGGWINAGHGALTGISIPVAQVRRIRLVLRPNHGPPNALPSLESAYELRVLVIAPE